ncbi:MAG TPA: isochorismatase family cysteine hydrolase [Oligoflexia bacterium]|nr:isochorismatase family cysteine hydrolase [Oligoflexia bacterium]HMR25340.1 isochorismatase family cysteine hydrolase [Oligoflexia bacterium]
MMKLAFLIIDMQKEFNTSSETEYLMQEASEYIVWTHRLFKHNHWPTIVIQDADMPDGKNNPGYAMIDALSSIEADAYVSKLLPNSFWETELNTILKGYNVDSVLLSGFNAAYCVTATYFGALERGWQPSILKNGIASHKERYVLQAQELFDCLSYNQIAAFIKSSSP